MQISISADHLRDSLSKILSVVDKKNTRAILNYCMISTQEDYLELVATDLEVAAKIRVHAEIIRSGKFCINAKNIFDIVREMPNDVIHISVDENTNILKLNCREINFALLVCNTEDFPHLLFENSQNKFIISSNLIQNIINKTSYAMSTDETRPFLNGVFLQQIQSKLRAVGTDGHRLALIDAVDFHQDNEILVDGIIIPKKGISEIKKLSDTNPDTEIEFSVDDSFIYANARNIHFVSIRLIAREFPSYQTVIPKKIFYRMTVDKGPILTAVKRIKILANERSNGVKLGLSGNNLIVSASHTSLGDASEKIKVEYSGNDIDIGFNAKYLIDTLNVLDETQVTFEFNNDLGPVIIKSINTPEYLGIIMPLKL